MNEALSEMIVKNHKLKSVYKVLKSILFLSIQFGIYLIYLILTDQLPAFFDQVATILIKLFR